MCSANRWNDDAKERILPTYFKGRAFAVYCRFTAEQKASYDTLVTALKEAFTPETAERCLARRQSIERSRTRSLC